MELFGQIKELEEEIATLRVAILYIELRKHQLEWELLLEDIPNDIKELTACRVEISKIMNQIEETDEEERELGRRRAWQLVSDEKIPF